MQKDDIAAIKDALENLKSILPACIERVEIDLLEKVPPGKLCIEGSRLAMIHFGATLIEYACNAEMSPAIRNGSSCAQGNS